jgi:hypothetical protein
LAAQRRPPPFRSATVRGRSRISIWLVIWRSIGEGNGHVHQVRVGLDDSLLKEQETCGTTNYKVCPSQTFHPSKNHSVH